MLYIWGGFLGSWEEDLPHILSNDDLFGERTPQALLLYPLPVLLIDYPIEGTLADNEASGEEERLIILVHHLPGDLALNTGLCVVRVWQLLSELSHVQGTGGALLVERTIIHAKLHLQNWDACL